MDGTVVRRALVLLIASFELVPMVGSEEHSGLLLEAETVKVVHQPSKCFIYPFDHSIVTRKVLCC